MNAYLLVIVILLIALAVTAGLLIFVVLKIFWRKSNRPDDTDAFIARLLDGFPVPVFEINQEHKVTRWNKALEVLSGIKKSDVMGTDEQWRAFYKEKRSLLADMIADGATDEEIVGRYKNNAKKSALIEDAYEAEGFFPHMGANGRWYRYTASPIKSGDRIIGAIEIMENVTASHMAEENLRSYASQITRGQEEDRKYIARELHDTTVQTLVALIYQLDDIVHGNPGLAEKDINRLKAMHDSLKNAVEEVRRFSRQLRPPMLDDLGLVPVLDWLTGELKTVSDMDVQMEIVGDPRRLEPDTELALFRIIQEALINAAKHARIKTVSVKIEYMSEVVRAVIADYGQGFELPRKVGSLAKDGKLGLAGMEERAQLLGGNLEISSGKGKGTVIHVEFPVKMS